MRVATGTTNDDGGHSGTAITETRDQGNHKMTNNIPHVNVESQVRAKSDGFFSGKEAREYIVDIDPALAAVMLSRRSESQRKLDINHARNLRREMEGNRWQYTGTTFVFNLSEGLIDGQHRLTAAVDAGFTFHQARVVFMNHEIDTLDAKFDIGNKARRYNDFVHAEMKRRGSGSIPKCIQAGVLFEANGHKRIPGQSENERARLIVSCEVLDHIMRLPRTSNIPSGIVAGIISCLRSDADEAVEFFSAVLRNDSKVHGDWSVNANLLSNWMFKAKQEKKYSGDTFIRECAFRTIKAWNDHREGRHPMQTPKYSESWPVPVAR